jgi:hypothetical protein
VYRAADTELPVIAINFVYDHVRLINNMVSCHSNYNNSTLTVILRSNMGHLPYEMIN